MVFKQKASWKCEPDDGFIYIENNNIDESGPVDNSEFLGTDQEGIEAEMVSEEVINPS